MGDAAQSPLRVGTLAIIGVGLIGGSFALALKKAGLVDKVWGVGRRSETLLQAKALGVIDHAVEIEQAAREADLIMVSAPVGAFDGIFKALAPHLSDRAVITDGGSTKGNVVAAAREGLGHRIGQFVPAHPIAGSHESGPQAAFADLYRDRNVVICPLPENSAKDIEFVIQAWTGCGAKLTTLEVEQHDAVMAAISHMPHWLASLYVTQIARNDNALINLKMAGAGFGDFSRIAQGSEEMWRDIFLANRDAMLKQIGQLHDLLGQAQKALKDNDVAWLEQMLSESAQVRRAWGAGAYQAPDKP